MIFFSRASLQTSICSPILPETSNLMEKNVGDSQCLRECREIIRSIGESVEERGFLSGLSLELYFDEQRIYSRPFFIF